MNIFVGNLSFDTTEGDVQKLFEGFGNVASVAIVTRKEEKASKSRGFGFVEMPVEQQALAAMAALSGKEFMGRILNASPARPKTEAQPFNKHLALKDWRVRPSGQPGTYRGGRRTRSYMNRRGLAGMQQEAKPRRSIQDNPMRWRKREDKVKPRQKSPGEHKPWKKAEEGASAPRKKTRREFKPWKKPQGEASSRGVEVKSVRKNPGLRAGKN